MLKVSQPFPALAPLAADPVAWADKQPGDLIFYTYRGNSEPHHVAIYLGGDRIVHAPQTGQNVGYGTLSDFDDEITTVRRLG